MTLRRTEFKVIAFDADDTLWRNEDIFIHAQDEFINLLLPYHDETYIRSHLGDVQIQNLEHFGYGIKGFTLSMIETAIELTEGRISGNEIHEIIQLAKCMLASPVELLPNVENVLSKLEGKARLFVITKGDLLDQESKLARSGIADYFETIEIVSDKTSDAYQQILQRHNIPTEHFLMVGNSLKSDILPVLDLGAQALHVPYHSTWDHEKVTDDTLLQYPQLTTLNDIADLLGWLDFSSLNNKQAV
ncbi:haloacid dehalogenase [Marinomonas primoryensis]|mgnify:FL=1|jgi:putative hydrolase of the HAD superfamily|uniref:HAD family hydrolase n=1 Tax=Marinomonas primoryensis TaxID=178399 RepID=A0A2Z4PUT7_9GAMM|nr:HAD family hydrolase [Marinomonas primoryensis]AWY00744.1 haloacid dehalogenase [Marinomonas primoryensis]QKK80722.1 haloacid delahogenase family hydrolase [Marinomonas primoryensis]|tara:strand:+ start:1203 stop:1940 length:738 start_codon:yes stop_codon:yes gene_type:complete